MLAATSSTSNASHTVTTTSQSFQIDDVFVFIALESLGTLAITGNLCLIIVLLRNKYLQRASFILMLSLAIADVLHGLVTTFYFYPPILLKRNHMPPFGVRLFNIIDWTAWSITLTHMSAICLDRLIAIMLYGRYNLIVTVKRIRFFTIFCWSAFFSINTIFIFALRACCLITPLENNQYYTFGYGEFERTEQKETLIFNGMNLFTFTYSPLEMTTLAILSISNPTTLIQLYRRHKRKIALRMASTMLLEMSMRMGSKHVNDDVRNLAARRSNRQQQRILLQISVVACLFYLYMVTYYLLYHVFDITNKWVVLFNSLFYSFTHMMNAIIYFSLNKDMRVQLIKAMTDFLSAVCCIKMSSDDSGSQRKASTEPRSSTKGVENSVTITETSPLFNANIANNNNNLRPALIISTNSGVEKLRISEFSASLKRLVKHNNSTTITKISITDEIVDSTGVVDGKQTDLILKEITNGSLPNGKHNCHNNSGFIDSNEPNSSMSKLTDESEEETRLLMEEEDGNDTKNEDQQSLMKSIVKAMHRIVLFDSSNVGHKILHSRSLDEMGIVGQKQRRSMKLSRTIHGINEHSHLNVNKSASKSQSFNEFEIEKEDQLLRDSLVLLINDANNTITTVQELDSIQCKYTPTPDDDIIFL